MSKLKTLEETLKSHKQMTKKMKDPKNECNCGVNCPHSSDNENERGRSKTLSRWWPSKKSAQRKKDTNTDDQVTNQKGKNIKEETEKKGGKFVINYHKEKMGTSSPSPRSKKNPNHTCNGECGCKDEYVVQAGIMGNSKCPCRSGCLPKDMLFKQHIIVERLELNTNVPGPQQVVDANSCEIITDQPSGISFPPPNTSLHDPEEPITLPPLSEKGSDESRKNVSRVGSLIGQFYKTYHSGRAETDPDDIHSEFSMFLDNREPSLRNKVLEVKAQYKLSDSGITIHDDESNALKETRK